MTDETRDPESPGPESEAAGEGAASGGGESAPESEGARPEGAESAPASTGASEPSGEAPSEAASSAPEGSAGASSAVETSAQPAATDDEDAEAKAKAAAAAKAKAEAAAKAKAAHEAAEAAKDPWERDPVVPDWEEVEDDDWVDSLREKHGEAIESARTFAGDLTLLVRRESIAEVCATAKDDGYTLPVDICGNHYPEREEGAFEVVYHLYSFEANRRIRLKVKTDEGVEVPSVTGVWVGANWHERETYDMYGIRFSGHPDMTRILLWEGFNGYPLRKDFPVEGIDTGSAIYPEYYEEAAGPIGGTGTGWKAPKPPEPEPESDGDEEADA